MRCMSGELLRRLLFRCNHQFSWPRQAEDGQHYQICVHCGSTYRYDWSRMRRIARVEPSSDSVSRRQCTAGARWKPRSRRLRHEVTVLIRTSGSKDWFEGTTENVSESGLLLRAPLDLGVGTSLELTLDMPREITGSISRVVCSGTVVRRSAAMTAGTYIVACSISDYKFARPKEIAS